LVGLASWKEAYQKLVELRPKHLHLIICRGRDHLLRSQWKEAAADYLKVIHDRPITDEWLEAAAALLMSGDEAGYRGLLRNLERKIVLTNPPHFADFVLARCAALTSKSGIEPAALIPWAKNAVGDEKNPWYVHALGLAHLRAGQFDEAIKRFQESNAGNWEDGGRSQNWLGMALAHAKAGRLDEARRSLDKAKSLIKLTLPQAPGLRPGILGPDWGAYQVLLRETEELLAEKKP
jgi:tetratricopeptide (TPR) repeat protein